MSQSYKSGRPRGWSKKEKLAVLKTADAEGMVVACRNHGVSSATYYTWKKIYEEQGEAGFQQDKLLADQQYKKLEEENKLGITDGDAFSKGAKKLLQPLHFGNVCFFKGQSVLSLDCFFC